jgi:RNA polymerase sigma factor (sigma-70 family)
MHARLLSNSLRLVGSSVLRTQTDDRLIALVRDGHDHAFAAIVQRYRPELERYCGPLVGPSRAEDAVQQTFVNAHRALMNDDRPIALRAWLYRIAHNASLNVLRSDAETPSGDPAQGEGGASAADVTLLRERLHETLAALAALPPAQRDALVMRELEGRSHVEIADALGVTAGAARQHLMRARAAVRSAATALTPYPLAAALGSAGGAVAGVGAGGMGGAALSKLGTSVAATAVLAGGAVGARPLVTGDATPAPARAAGPSPRPAADTARDSATATPAAVVDDAPGVDDHGGRRHDDRGSGGSRDDDSRGSGSSDVDHHRRGDGDSTSEHSGPSGSRPDDGRGREGRSDGARDGSDSHSSGPAGDSDRALDGSDASGPDARLPERSDSGSSGTVESLSEGSGDSGSGASGSDSGTSGPGTSTSGPVSSGSDRHRDGEIDN